MSTRERFSSRYRPDETERQDTETHNSTEVERTCPECDSRLLTDEARGEVTCDVCGLVVETDIVDRGPEWRTFADGERTDGSRVGAPTTGMLHDRGLSSHISWANRDSYGHALSARQRAKMNRLRTWDERYRTRNSKERNLKHALGEIDRMASALGLSREIRETASVIYRRALAEGLLPGRTIESIATAALYAAARQMNAPRTITEVTAVSRIDETTFTRAYRYLVRELSLVVPLASPEDFVGRFASDLGLTTETEHRSRELLRAIEGEASFTGKNPVGLAAAAIYAAGQLTGQQLTQREVAATTDISEVTIRQRYVQLLEAEAATAE